MMWLEWLAIVLADMTIHSETGFASQIAVEKPRIVVLNNDGTLAG
jgi:hypothetical protein